MTASNGLWIGTPLEAPSTPTIDTALARIFAKDAHLLDVAASELASEAAAISARDPEFAAATRLLADRTQAQADRLWARVERMLGGGD